MNVLITGANRGIGLGLTKEFLSKDFHVIGTARKPEAAEALHRHSERYPEHLTICQADVTDPVSVANLKETLLKSKVSIDILVNNAGISLEKRDTPLLKVCMDNMDSVFSTNVTGVARITQALLPLIPTHADAKIVNISSGAGLIGEKSDSLHFCYGTSKAALNMLTRTLAFELGPKGIIVTAVSPGWVRTDMGGPEAALSIEESTGRLAETILSMTAKDNSCLLNFDGKPKSSGW